MSTICDVICVDNSMARAFDTMSSVSRTLDRTKDISNRFNTVFSDSIINSCTSPLSTYLQTSYNMSAGVQSYTTPLAPICEKGVNAITYPSDLNKAALEDDDYDNDQLSNANHNMDNIRKGVKSLAHNSWVRYLADKVFDTIIALIIGYLFSQVHKIVEQLLLNFMLEK